jgi:hypothetical protein
MDRRSERRSSRQVRTCTTGITVIRILNQCCPTTLAIHCEPPLLSRRCIADLFHRLQNISASFLFYGGETVEDIRHGSDRHVGMPRDLFDSCHTRSISDSTFGRWDARGSRAGAMDASTAPYRSTVGAITEWRSLSEVGSTTCFAGLVSPSRRSRSILAAVVPN